MESSGGVAQLARLDLEERRETGPETGATGCAAFIRSRSQVYRNTGKVLISPLSKFDLGLVLATEVIPPTTYTYTFFDFGIL